MKTSYMAGLLVFGAVAVFTASGHITGPDERHTGAPGDDPLACATSGCHTSLKGGGPINPAGGGVTATFSGGSTYTPGGPAITVTVSVSDPVNTHYGFQMTARLDSDQVNGQAGDFTVGGTNQVILCANGSPKRSSGCPAGAKVQFIEHFYQKDTPAGTTPYTFTWTPPATNVGPVHFYVAGNAVNNNGMEDGGDHVYTAAYTLPPMPSCTVSAPVVASANSGTDFGGATTITPGTWVEIKGSNLASNTRIWTGGDFNGASAPTALDSTSVTINGKSAFVYYISPTQINVQAPADTLVGSAPIVVKNCTGSASSPISVQENGLVPGWLAPASFIVNGKQYLVAQFPDGSYVGNPGMISGITFRQAKPGETVIIYGIGFGDVNPSISPGVIVTQANNLVNALSVKFGSTTATTTYQGLAPNFIGLYQFNITVPNVADGDQQVNVTLKGTALPQTFYLPVKK